MTDEAEVDWQTRGAAWSRDVLAWRDRLATRVLRPQLASTAGTRAGFPARALDAIRGRKRQLFARPTSVPLQVAQPPDNGAASPSSEAGRPLDPGVQQQLEHFLRMRLPPVRIHSGIDADRITRRVGADAVSTAGSVYFRKGAFRPESRSGMALLAHEMTHVAWREGARPVPLSTGRALPAEEEVALANERRYLAQRPGMALLPPAAMHATPRAVPPAPPAAAAPATPPPFTHAAMADRDLDQGSEPVPQAPLFSHEALRALKEELFVSLLDRLRSDFERGA